MVSGASGIILGGETQSAVVIRDETGYPEPGHGTRNPLPVSTDSLFTFRTIIKTEVGFNGLRLLTTISWMLYANLI